MTVKNKTSHSELFSVQYYNRHEYLVITNLHNVFIAYQNPRREYAINTFKIYKLFLTRLNHFYIITHTFEISLVIY